MTLTCNPWTWGIARLAAAMWIGSLTAPNGVKAQPVEQAAATMTGLDHVAEHLSVQYFWVDGHHAHQAGKGGSQVCCVSLPVQWRSGLSVHVKWGVRNWRDHVFSMRECDVPVTRYAKPGRLCGHFLADGSVQVISSDIGLGFSVSNPEYAGPQPLSALPLKRPWKDYKATRPEGVKEFSQVADAMKFGGS